MKKNEYMAPEVESVEFIEQCNILDASLGGGDRPEQKDDDDEVVIPGGRL